MAPLVVSLESLVVPRWLRARQVATLVLPGEDTTGAHVVTGEFHDVVLLSGRAVVKVAHGSAVEHLQQRAHLLTALASEGLPFKVPEPLTPVSVLEDCAAVALPWVPGHTAPAGRGNPERLREVLAALAGVDGTGPGGVGPWLDSPHAYAGRGGWAQLMGGVVQRLPEAVREQASARVQAVMDLPAVAPVLVHGDLAGENVRWTADGAITGIIDWDLASPFDPAVDAACWAWFGWDTVAAAVDPATYQRALTWAATSRMESVAAAIDNGEPDTVINQRVEAAAQELSATRSRR